MKKDSELLPELKRVAREGGTEAPFTGKYWNTKEKGMYKCAICGAELFSSDTKFDSGTGWPSFTEPANRKNIELREDRSGGTVRTEVRCKKCGAHLGHVFDDLPRFAGKAGGPKEKGGKRYCINSVCLKLSAGGGSASGGEKEKNKNVLAEFYFNVIIIKWLVCGLMVRNSMLLITV